MAAVRCPNCKADFRAEASTDGRYRVMHCPECAYPMTDLIVPFLRNRDARQRSS